MLLYLRNNYLKLTVNLFLNGNPHLEKYKPNNSSFPQLITSKDTRISKQEIPNHHIQTLQLKMKINLISLILKTKVMRRFIKVATHKKELSKSLVLN